MRWKTPERQTVHRQAKRLVGWLVVLAFVAITVAVVFLGTPFEGPSASIEAVDSDDGVSLERTNGGYVLEPTETDAETGEPTITDTNVGLVFYPGARVTPSAYVESLAPVAREANVTVVIPSMPLNLAIVDYGVARTGLRSHAATAEMAERPDIEQWYVGGHSLGGAMACWYADDHRDDVEGLVLYGSYCDRNIADRGLAVLSSQAYRTRLSTPATTSVGFRNCQQLRLSWNSTASTTHSLGATAASAVIPRQERATKTHTRG